jgi:N-acyl-D-amino-acid deacylase
MWDYLIKNGFVVDGTGAPWFKTDVALSEGRIEAMSPRLPASKADVVYDAKGLIVSPGFIDMHSHSELPMLAFPKADSMIHQGVTTEFTCQCGISMSGPLQGSALDAIDWWLAQARVDPKEFEVDWSSLAEYMARFERQGCSINGAYQAGHGTVRLGVMGWENRAPTRDELDEMKALVAQTMEDGAFGFSTGLMYTPGNYGETEEVIELAKVAAKYGGIHTCHDRRRGWESDPRGGRDFVTTTIDSEIWSIMEVIRIGEEAGLPTTWTHAKACGKVNWTKSLEGWFKIIDMARRRGVDVGIDVYPWTFRGGIVRGFPTWAEEGGPEKVRERLRDPETYNRIRAYVKEQMETVLAEHTWDRALILTTAEEDNDLRGKYMTEASEMRGMEPVDLFLDRIREGKEMQGIGQAMHEDDVKTLLRHPLSMVCTDGSCLPADYDGLAHPRNYGTFPRILRKYVRQERVLTMEDAIRKMTSAGATKLGIMDRGILRPGFWADVTVFDPLNVRENATYEDPTELSTGIEYVFVNGVLTIEHDKHTGALAGKPLKHVALTD